MHPVEIVEVSDRKGLREFTALPKTLYGDDPYWCPPIWMEERKAYESSHNPVLAGSDFVLFLAIRDGRTEGRILAYIDRSFLSFYGENIGFFGAFESVDSTDTADALIAAAEAWVRNRGMSALRGPINPIAEHWGFVLEGYDSPPIFLSPYNAPYYHRFFTDRDFLKVKDLLAYEADLSKGYQIAERYTRFYAKFLARHPGFTIRRIDMSRLMEDAESIWRLSNESLSDNWGYVPVDRGIMLDILRRLKTILDPDAVWFVEDGGKPVGYCLGYPDVNKVLKRIGGRMLPIGFLALLRDVKKVRDYRLFALAVHPDYHGMGLDVLMYIHLHRALKPKGIRLEANYILEDNTKIRNALEKLDMKPIKRYRIYQKNLV